MAKFKPGDIVELNTKFPWYQEWLNDWPHLRKWAGKQLKVVCYIKDTILKVSNPEIDEVREFVEMVLCFAEVKNSSKTCICTHPFLNKGCDCGHITPHKIMR